MAFGQVQYSNGVPNEDVEIFPLEEGLEIVFWDDFLRRFECLELGKGQGGNLWFKESWSFCFLLGEIVCLLHYVIFRHLSHLSSQPSEKKIRLSRYKLTKKWKHPNLAKMKGHRGANSYYRCGAHAQCTRRMTALPLVLLIKAHGPTYQGHGSWNRDLCWGIDAACGQAIQEYRSSPNREPSINDQKVIIDILELSIENGFAATPRLHFLSSIILVWAMSDRLRQRYDWLCLEIHVLHFLCDI